MALQNSTPNKQQAAMLMQKGQPEQARQLLQQICSNPLTGAEEFYLLGNCNGALGYYQEAVEALQKSLQLQPKVAQSHYVLGGALKMLNNLDEASAQFQQAIEINPRMAEAHIALADIWMLLEKIDEAYQYYEKARTLQPKLAAAYFGLGTITEQRGDYNMALKYFKRAAKYEPELPQYQCAVASKLANLNQIQEARGIYLKTLSATPEYPDALGGLALIYDQTGEYEKAVKKIEPLLRKNILNIPAAIAFIHVCKHLGRCDEAIEYIENVLQNYPDLTAKAQVNLHMPTARTLDSMGRYDEAFSHFKAGNEVVNLPYDPAGHLLTINRIIKTFGIDTFMRLPRARIKTDRPIFIVGMPRSGTSLTEQIIAAHPDAEGAGELTDLANLMDALPTELASTRGWPECIEELTRDDMDRFSRKYLNRLRKVSKKATRVTDKMPHNFQLLGLIQLLFPEARVIHCRRDPMDTCLSIYFQNFLVGHPYARNLFNLGTHYKQYLRLMEHWQQVLSIPILDVHYEELVSDPETNVRKILEFCDLEWNDNCMQFHKVKRKVNTASYDQVRQPLYTKSVQRWRHYEQYLDKLKEGLQRDY